MCISIPARILEIVDPSVPLVKVDMGGLVKILPSIMEDPRVSDYVTVYGGAVIDRMDVEAYNNAVKLWKEVSAELSRRG